MYVFDSRVPHCSIGRLTLAGLLAVLAITTYPWSTTSHRLLALGALSLMVFVIGWRQGLHFTTLLYRRIALMRSGSHPSPPHRRARDVSTTVVLRLSPQESLEDIPVDLISTYLDRYGLRATMIRITNSYHWRQSGLAIGDTWIGLTYSALNNLDALQARSSQIPLEETTEIAGRRLADHLRELGWEVTMSSPEDLPCFLEDHAEETWHSIRDHSHHYTSVYQLDTDRDLVTILAGLRPNIAQQVWTIIELTGSRSQLRGAIACVIRSDTIPDSQEFSDLGLICQRGYQRASLALLDPRSTQPLPDHHPLTTEQLAQLHLPVDPRVLEHQSHH